MTAIAIDEQVRAIRNATELATKSKESAMQFLRDAGIIKGDSSSSGQVMSPRNSNPQQTRTKK